MKSVFNLFKNNEKKRITVKITNGKKYVELKLSSIYNFDNTLKPIVLTIPKGQECISISDEDIISMVQFINTNYPNPELTKEIKMLGEISVSAFLGTMPPVFSNMTFNFLNPNEVKEGFQYFAAAVLKASNNKAIGIGMFFNVVKEENINKYFETNN